jgi:biotin carboxyl carrier protein
MGSVASVRRIGEGVYLVEVDGRSETVYVAGPPEDRWAFWNGRVFRGDFRDEAGSGRARKTRPLAKHALSAPMPATVIHVHVKPGDAVKKGDTVVLLEAMKMELPILAASDAVVAAVHCRAGELVQADAPLVELE